MGNKQNHTTRACTQGNSLDNSESDRRIICLLWMLASPSVSSERQFHNWCVKINKCSLYLASHTSAELIWFTTAVWSQNKQILLWFNSINRSKECQNNYIMMPICEKSEFMLCQVCLQDDKQTTFKMLVFWKKFGSIRAVRNRRLHL